MYAFATIASLLAVASPAVARIAGITVPPTVQAGADLYFKVQFEDELDNYNDFGMVLGLARPEYDCGQCAGTFLQYIDLTQTDTSDGNKSYEVFIDQYTTPGEYHFKLGNFYLQGASGGTFVGFYNSTVTVTNATSS